MIKKLAIISGLAFGGLVTTVLAQAPVVDLSQDQASSSRQGGASLEERVSKLERLLENQTLVDMALRLESLQQEVQNLSGDMEVQTHNIEELKRRQRDLYLDIDRRIQKMEASGPPSVGGVTPSGTSSVNPETGSGSGTIGMIPPTSGAPSTEGGVLGGGLVQDNNTQEEKSAYQKAFALLRDGKYDMATQEFKEFLSHYPQGSYADNAQYWLGEINYVQRKFDLALAEFNKVLNKFPNSPKYADAMLKIGLTYYELEYWDQARKVFNDLVSKFPNTAESQIAEKRLQQMKVDGHS